MFCSIHTYIVILSRVSRNFMRVLVYSSANRAIFYCLVIQLHQTSKAGLE